MDPPIEAFIPTKLYNEESTVEIKDLEKLIQNAEVEDAMLVYDLLQKGKAEISPELKQSFFEMICFYNCEEPLDEDLVEERWFRQSERGKERYKNTWKEGGLAEKMFSEIEVKDSTAYSTVIRGMCKYYQIEKAYSLFNDALAKNIAVDVESYNSLLNCVNFLKESTELRWEMLLDLLNIMKSQKVEPNLGTLNACLNSVRLMGGKMTREYCLSILTEFKRLNIEPSLASWTFVLHIFCRERGPVSHVLIDIMKEIEGKEFQIQEIRDTMFFNTAMDIARNHLNDKHLARRINDLLHTGDNYNLIGDSFKESIYYRNYFMVLMGNEPFEVFMETYFNLVPNVYVPEPIVMEEVLKNVEVNGAIEHLPLFWSNMVQFDHVSRESLLALIAKIMVENTPSPSIPSHKDLTEKFAVAAHDIFTKVEEKNESRMKAIVWTGKLLSDIIYLICRNEDFQKANEVFDKLYQNQNEILGEPEVAALQKFVELCIAKKQPTPAIQCLQLCSDVGFTEANEMAKEIVKGFTLDGTMLRKVVQVVGLMTVEEAEAEKQKIRDAKLQEIQRQQEQEQK